MAVAISVLAGTGSLYVVCESPEQMAEPVRAMQAAGAHVSISHISSVRAIGKKEITARDASFNRAVDPYGLLNPGRFEAAAAAEARFELDLPTDGWSRRIARACRVHGRGWRRRLRPAP